MTVTDLDEAIAFIKARSLPFINNSLYVYLYICSNESAYFKFSHAVVRIITGNICLCSVRNTYCVTHQLNRH